MALLFSLRSTIFISISQYFDARVWCERAPIRKSKIMRQRNKTTKRGSVDLRVASASPCPDDRVDYLHALHQFEFLCIKSNREEIWERENFYAVACSYVSSR